MRKSLLDSVSGSVGHEDGEGGTPPSKNRSALRGIAYALIGGSAVIILFSADATGMTQFLGTASVGLLVAGASSMVGGLLGFLFGIPRSLQGSGTSTGPSSGKTQSGNSADDQAGSYGANTNLEQISDWLTKILVGVGLTKLGVLPEKLQALASFVSPGFGALPHPDVIAIAVVLYFAVSGFLFGYLWTRLYLGAALREADVAALGKKISELEKQMSEDAKALGLVQEQLNPRSDSPDVSQGELRGAIIRASKPVKTTIFYQAVDVRNKNWRDEKNKPIMERTIPIFRALVDDDHRDEYHANHGQLGFALKDKRSPDWTEAEKELTKAIEIRGDWRTQGFLFYEFNRAICRIRQEEGNQIGKQPVSPNREEILADLKAVATNDYLFQRIQLDQAVRNWMNANQITEGGLRH
jgi:hypothetical protein